MQWLVVLPYCYMTEAFLYGVCKFSLHLCGLPFDALVLFSKDTAVGLITDHTKLPGKGSSLPCCSLLLNKKCSLDGGIFTSISFSCLMNGCILLNNLFRWVYDKIKSNFLATTVILCFIIFHKYWKSNDSIDVADMLHQWGLLVSEHWLQHYWMFTVLVVEEAAFKVCKRRKSQVSKWFVSHMGSLWVLLTLFCFVFFC